MDSNIPLNTLTILFGTGGNGRVLLKNMQALHLDPGAVDLLFLSHPHWDHMGGLDSFLEVNPHATVVLHEGFSKQLIRDLKGLCGKLIVVGDEPEQLLPGVHSTGQLDSDSPEQAMIFETGSDVVAISGCSHPGMENIVQHVNRFMDKPVTWAIGGFHLMYRDQAAIEQTIHTLMNLGVKWVVPTHCSGDLARSCFQRSYGEHYIDGGAGREIRFPD